MWQAAAAGCFWLAVAYKAQRVLRAPSPAGWTLLAMLVYPTIAATVIAPPVYLWVDDVTGWSNVGTLIASAAGLIGLVPCFNVLLHSRLDRASVRIVARRRYGVATCCVVLQLVLWTQVTAMPTDPLFALTGAQDGAALAVLLIHQLGLAGGGAVCVLASWRLASERRGPLRIGLLAMVTTGVAATGLVVLNIAYYISVQLGSEVRSTGTVLISLYAVYVALSGLALGVTLGDWWPPVVRHLICYRQMQHLQPAWQLLVAAAPEATRGKVHPGLGGPSRLHRMVVEIHDAAVLVRRQELTQDLAPPPSPAAALAAAIRERSGAGRARNLRSLDEEVRFLLEVTTRPQVPGWDGHSRVAAVSAARAARSQE